MVDRTCVICSGPLTGKQIRYCKPLCASRGLNQARKADGRLKAEREANKESRAQWNRDNRHRYIETRLCDHCGQPLTTNRYQPTRFHRQCAVMVSRTKRPVQSKFPFAHQVGPLRQALEDKDLSAFLIEIQKRTEAVGQCWLWQGSCDNKGYPKLNVGSRNKRRSGHRVLAELIQGDPLPSYMPVHHVCANRSCLNPAHLQVVQPHENAAEMLERAYYRRRIAELTEALGKISPKHPALIDS